MKSFLKALSGSMLLFVAFMSLFLFLPKTEQFNNVKSVNLESYDIYYTATCWSLSAYSDVAKDKFDLNYRECMATSEDNSMCLMMARADRVYFNEGGDCFSGYIVSDTGERIRLLSTEEDDE